MNDNLKTVLATMLNANITLNAMSDNGHIAGSLARQARQDAIALSQAIALLNLDSNHPDRDFRAALAVASELLQRKDEKIEQLTTQMIQLMDEINRH